MVGVTFAPLRQSVGVRGLGCFRYWRRIDTWPPGGCGLVAALPRG